MTHTPGPWEYDGGAQIVEVARPHMRICFLPSDHADYASSEHNGRLIAAAPDLLRALQNISAGLNSEFDSTPRILAAEVKAARAAIAKATGA